MNNLLQPSQSQLLLHDICFSLSVSLDTFVSCSPNSLKQFIWNLRLSILAAEHDPPSKGETLTEPVSGLQIMSVQLGEDVWDKREEGGGVERKRWMRWERNTDQN